MGRVTRHPRCGWSICFCLIATIGCGGANPSNLPLAAAEDAGALQSPTSLIAHELWRLVAPADDPYWVEDGTRIPCESLDVELYDEAVEVNTRFCNHATLMQPSLYPVESGESVHQELWWQPLISETPAITRLRLRVGSVALLEEDLSIPGSADVRHRHSLLTTTIPAGTPIYFHVSNHGVNSYTLHRLEVEAHPSAIHPTEQ
jgi:hypothetical protein